MELTEDIKKHIDSLSYAALLQRWRFARVGDPWFQTESGTYWASRMEELRAAPSGDAEHTVASKAIGWDR